NAEEARQMLQRLANATHEVLTGIAVATDAVESTVVTTRVRFRAISPEEIDAYWASGEPRDKAGAYAIQGLGAMFVSHIEGSYSNVVGLPLYETLQLLDRHGIASMSLLRGACA